MSPHNSDDTIELFSMSRLQEPELAGFEEHLLLCEDCQDAVCRMDLFRDTIQAAAEHLWRHEGSTPRFSVPTRFKGEYLLVQAALPNANLENIGILLLDADSDRLYCRFRRDFEEFAGTEADYFEQLPHDISEKVNVLGGQKCLQWMESTFSNTLRISSRRSVFIEDYATTVESLYAEHIRPKVLRFRTHLPQFSLEAAAGKFGRQMAVEPEGWVEISTDIPLTEDMFVTHIEGHSMEPQIPDASLCVFRSKIVGSREGKVLLIEQYGELGGNRYTVKLWRASQAADPNQLGDETWLHERVTLESINQDYKSWDVASAEKIRVLGEFLFIV